jgi:thiosulfate/3-mercaptopyruvate sulfurtransferase
MSTTIISPAEAAKLSAESLFFDCRHNLFDLSEGVDNYTAGHLPGAYHLHMDEVLSGEIIPGKTGRHPLPEMDAFAVFISRFGLRKETQVVCYDDKGGGLAARLWWMLKVLGHEAVAVLDGGVQAWATAGLPLEPGYHNHPVANAAPLAPHFAPYSPLCTRDRAQVDALRNAPDHTVVDSRTAPRYRGEQEPIDPVAGHIEGAVNLPWPENLQDGKLKSKAALKARFSELKEDADKNVFYCGSGVTACHNILAYTHAYGEMPLLYPGSWSEWITLDNRN